LAAGSRPPAGKPLALGPPRLFHASQQHVQPVLAEDGFAAEGASPSGPNRGRKVFTLQALAACADDLPSTVGKEAGFSPPQDALSWRSAPIHLVHAGVAAHAHERDKVERLCRCVSLPPVAECRLPLTSNGDIRYRLKTPHRDGNTHVIFRPLDVIARLAALQTRQSEDRALR